MDIHEGDRFIYKDIWGYYDVEVVNINEYRPPDQKYAIEVSVDGNPIGCDFAFVGDDFFDKCKRNDDNIT